MAAVAAIAAVGAGLLSARQQRSAGIIQKAESETQAKLIETQAAAREADRKEALSRAAASQAAGTGASGILFEGSPLSVLEEDIRREGVASEREGLGAALSSQSERMRGRVAQSAARGRATVGLLQTVSRAASLAPPSTAPTT